MKYGIVAFPSKKLQALANTYRKRYDPHYALISPHLTIKDAFDADDAQISEITQQIKQITNASNPLNVHASRISSFYPTTNTIFFRVEPTPQLESLHTKLQEAIQFGTEKHVFVPHITIAQNLSASEHDDIFGQLRMIGVDEQETINEIHLMSQQEGSSWTVYETFKLNGAE